jgi:hypothetical protein
VFRRADQHFSEHVRLLCTAFHLTRSFDGTL